MVRMDKSFWRITLPESRIGLLVDVGRPSRRIHADEAKRITESIRSAQQPHHDPRRRDSEVRARTRRGHRRDPALVKGGLVIRANTQGVMSVRNRKTDHGARLGS